MASGTAVGVPTPLDRQSSHTVSDQHLLEAVDHVQIPVRDRHRAAEWYSRTLGLKIHAIGGPGDDQAFLELPTGPLLCLWETEPGSHSRFTHRGAPARLCSSWFAASK